MNRTTGLQEGRRRQRPALEIESHAAAAKQRLLFSDVTSGGGGNFGILLNARGCRSPGSYTQGDLKR